MVFTVYSVKFRGFRVKIISGDLDTGYTEEHGIHGKEMFFGFSGKAPQKAKESVASLTQHFYAPQAGRYPEIGIPIFG